MRYIFQALIASVAIAACGGAADARSIEIYLNDDSARGTVTLPLMKTGLDIDFGVLHNSDEGNLFHSGVYVAGFAGKGTSKLELSLGGRVLLADADRDDGSGIGFGGRLEYQVPKLEQLTLGTHVFFAPNSTSFGDVDEMLDFGVSAGYQVMDEIELFLNATQVKVEFDGGVSARVDKGLHLGFRARF